MGNNATDLVSDVKHIITSMGLTGDVRLEEQHGELVILTGLRCDRTDTLYNLNKCKCCGDLLTDDRTVCELCRGHSNEQDGA